MRAVAQRVGACRVLVGGRETGSIEGGLLVYLGVGRNDSEKDTRSIADKLVNLRIFPDSAGKMNLSVREAGGSVLVVSQFTLYGDVRDGRRPSWIAAAEPEKARAFYEAVISAIRAAGLTVASGEFQAFMEVTCTNLGPVTILVDSEKTF